MGLRRKDEKKKEQSLSARMYLPTSQGGVGRHSSHLPVALVSTLSVRFIISYTQKAMATPGTTL